MAELCGPSNALANFQKHSSVDRTLQQDKFSPIPIHKEVNTPLLLYARALTTTHRASSPLLVPMQVSLTQSLRLFKQARRLILALKSRSSTLPHPDHKPIHKSSTGQLTFNNYMYTKPHMFLYLLPPFVTMHLCTQDQLARGATIS